MKNVSFVCALLLATPAPAGAAEDFRVMKLEQDVRTLERNVQALQRQLAEMQRQLPGNTFQNPVGRADRDPAAGDREQRWLSAAAWNRVQEGMSELQVVEILGTPTALRGDGSGRRALLYTLEIGTTGFLTGSVSFEGGKVVDVQQPRLK